MHTGNIVLGKLALRGGDLKEAKARLLSAAVALGGSDRIWFDPDFSLAKSLLERGQRKIVLRYFRLCSRFWADKRNKMDDWIALVRNGRIPSALRDD